MVWRLDGNLLASIPPLLLPFDASLRDVTRAELRFHRRPPRTLSCATKSGCVHSITLLMTLLAPEAAIPAAALDLKNSSRSGRRSSPRRSCWDGRHPRGPPVPLLQGPPGVVIPRLGRPPPRLLAAGHKPNPNKTVSISSPSPSLLICFMSALI